MDLGAAKFVVGMKIEPNVIAGTCILTHETATGTVLECYEIPDAFPTKSPSKVRRARIAEDLV